MYYVQLAPLGGISGPLKSDLGVFLPFPAIILTHIKFAKCDVFLGPINRILKLAISGMAVQIQPLG